MFKNIIKKVKTFPKKKKNVCCMIKESPCIFVYTKNTALPNKIYRVMFTMMYYTCEP